MPQTQISTGELHAALCVHDPRNPLHAQLADPDEAPVSAAEPGCGCDNCFYGRHRLAAALLDCRANS